MPQKNNFSLKKYLRKSAEISLQGNNFDTFIELRTVLMKIHINFCRINEYFCRIFTIVVSVILHLNLYWVSLFLISQFLSSFTSQLFIYDQSQFPWASNEIDEIYARVPQLTPPCEASGDLLLSGPSRLFSATWVRCAHSFAVDNTTVFWDRPRSATKFKDWISTFRINKALLKQFVDLY